MANENEKANEESAEQTRKTAKAQKDFAKALKDLGVNIKDFDEEIQTSEQLWKSAQANITGVVVGGIVKNFKSAALSAMSTGDAFAMATSSMHSNIEMLGSGFKVGSDSMIKAGQDMLKHGDKNGAKMVVAGQALGALTGAIVELTKAGIDFMMSQTKTLISGFQQLNSVGATFGGGMSEMADTALKGGMTMEQFGKAVSENKDKLAGLGIGVAEGSKRLTGAMNAGGKAARDAMMGFGMTMEEQASAYATVMQRMAGPNKNLTASNSEIAAQTMKYVENLKVLQSLTGEDIKAKQDTIRQENDNLAFQQKLGAMDPKKRAELEAAMEDMTEGQRRALRENMIYGSVISQDLAIAQATNAGIRKGNEDILRSVNDGSISQKKVMDIQADTRDQTQRDAMANQGLAMSNSEAAKGASKAMLEDWKYKENFSKEGLAKARKAAEDAKKPGAGKGADLMAVQQDTAIALQKIARDNLPEFATALKDTVSQMQSAVEVMANGGSKLATFMGGWGGMLVSTIGAVIGGLLPTLLASRGLGGAAGVAGAAGGGALEKALGSAGSAAGGVGKAAGGAAGGALQGLAGGMTALANPMALAGLAAFTLSMMGLGKALEYAAPGIKAISEGVSVVLKQVAESLTMMSNEANPMGLLAIAPGLLAVGAALIPFGIGGALAGLAASGGGLDNVVGGIQKFESLDPNKLSAVATAMGKINQNLPSVVDLAKYAAVAGIQKALGSSTGSSTTTPAKDDPMAKLVSLHEETLKNQKEMLRYIRDNASTSDKIHRVLA